ncbi:MAG: zinc ribbon domain-containing protein [Fimbriimonas sp.]
MNAAQPTCPHCGAAVPPNAQTCANCGQPLAAATKTGGGGTALRVVAVLVLLFISCPIGLLGAVQLILAISGGAPAEQLTFGISMLVLGALGIPFAIWAFRRR